MRLFELSDDSTMNFLVRVGSFRFAVVAIKDHVKSVLL
jgi:hypothetical protein